MLLLSSDGGSSLDGVTSAASTGASSMCPEHLIDGLSAQAAIRPLYVSRD
jgi:hypothetical protein